MCMSMCLATRQSGVGQIFDFDTGPFLSASASLCLGDQPGHANIGQ